MVSPGLAMQFRELGPGFHVAQSRAMSYNCGVLVDSGRACLIDPGVFPDELANIGRFLSEQAAEPVALILTHSHWDHLFGPGHFAPARTVAQQEFRSTRHGLRNPEIVRRTLAEIERWDVEQGVMRDRPFSIPMPDAVFDAALTLLIKDRPVQLISAPGHWPDQLVAFEPEAGILWAGDMLSDVEIPYVSQSLVEYERTLQMLRGLEIKVLVPGHGSPTSDEDEINRRLMNDISYLAELHRAVGSWLEQGQLPDSRDELQREFRPSVKLEANAWPHRLNCETAWLELGGAKLDGRSGWECR